MSQSSATDSHPALAAILSEAIGPARAQRTLQQVQAFCVAPLQSAKADPVPRAVIAQALCLALFSELLLRVPSAAASVQERVAAGERVCFDHGAVRTVRTVHTATGALPPGHECLTRVLVPLGYEAADVYPLPRLGMTGRAWRHADAPADIPQFFISELHPERFSPAFQQTVGRVLADSRDPLSAHDAALLQQLARAGSLPQAVCGGLVARLLQCFERQHGLFSRADYEQLRNESPEMAWIATEGQTFNHATDRVADLADVMAREQQRGRRVKGEIEVSRSGRIRQSAFLADPVRRVFLDPDSGDGRVVELEVPGSFYEFIQRERVDGELDLAFDAGNATGIFGMTRGAAAASPADASANAATSA